MSTTRTIQVLFKLLPSVFALRRDRKNGLIKKKTKLIQNSLEKMHVKYLTLLFP